MITTKQCTAAIALTALGIAVLMQVPQWLHMQDARWKGVMVHLNSDEAVYLAHTEEVVTGRPEQSDEAFIGDPEIVGTHFALIERIVGSVFRPTGWRAATVLQIMDSVTPPLIFLALVLFFSLCGFRLALSYVGAVLFVGILFYGLGRPIQQRESFLLTVLCLSALIAGVQRRWILGMVGGALLGILIGVYFWSWTYAWAWYGLLAGTTVVSWLWERRTDEGASPRQMRDVLLFGVVGVAAAVPFVWHILSISRDPFYADAKFRSGIFPNHFPESLPYSILFALMASGLAVAWLRTVEVRRYRYAIIGVFTSLIVINQQIVHGVTFNFVSHYLFLLVLSAIGVLLIAWSAPSRWTLLAASGAIVYLAAIAYDNRFVIEQFRVQAGRFEEQHLASLLPVIDTLPRARILTDPVTSLFIAGSTQHDVVYTIYLKNLLLRHEQIAQRYCATQLPVAPELRNIAGQDWLIYPDSNGAFRSPSIRQAEVAMVEAACSQADRDPQSALRTLGIQYVLWDHKRQPKWNLERMGVVLGKVAETADWSLWKIDTPSDSPADR